MEDLIMEIKALEKQFETVLPKFKENFMSGRDTAAQFAVYHKGKKVIDLAGHIPTFQQEYSSNTVSNIFSAGKTVAALATTTLVDKGFLSYSEKVSTYWPEFAQNGKGDILVEDVLRHDSGLAMLRKEDVPMEVLFPDKRGELVKLMETAKPMWSYRKDFDEFGRACHAVTRGYILDELCRRADPKNRGIADIVLDLRDEICKVSEVDKSDYKMFLGNIPKEEEKFYMHYKFEELEKELEAVKSHTDEWSKDVKPEFKDQQKKAEELAAEKGQTSLFEEIIEHVIIPKYEASNDLLRLGCPSTNFLTNARSLAAFGNAFIFGGVLSPDGVKGFLDKPTTKFDLMLSQLTAFTQGGACVFEAAAYPAILKGFYGWFGLGGCVFAFNPEKEISVGYVPNRYERFSDCGFMNARFMNMMNEVLKII